MIDRSFVPCSRPRRCVVKQYGCVPYAIALAEQRSHLEQRLQDPSLEDLLLLLEHPPVYTLGTGSDLAFVKFDPQQAPYELHRTERGGEVTYHCPGQLVGYPILNLRHYQPDLHWYLRQLEAVILHVLADYGLKGDRIPGLTGVWVEGYKVAAIGIKVKRWMTMHGFALNVCPDLRGFERITPCGITDRPVGSLSQFIPTLTVEAVRPKIISAFAHVFGVEMVENLK
ncbi:lipoyl(octanoyl) transferase LipB [Spirulina subsalsa FACHB-351]|uniref:Octanoyltransferase n=1 Tax=Spirulina subsalsa FACHB-351 TaxID=234711 RepID=A0ABT3L741_9CYAN|nr:lipoyl(octanoyl) transferase LipB [Spirulina subsalsa]MCW6037002.1 lipoyl(octanoyl) transferase LipB [Spirulina subsalsa FACHB-351]